MEDIDRPRVQAGAQELQLADLKALGLEADVLLVQSHFRARHWELFAAGVHEGRIYACDCSRKDVQSVLAGIASAPHDDFGSGFSFSFDLHSHSRSYPHLHYSGHCRSLPSQRPLRATESIAWRFRMPQESGREDFIVARSGVALDTDGLPIEATFVPAYHWACAIDDFDGHYDLLVRGADLQPSARVQRAIQAWLQAWSSEGEDDGNSDGDGDSDGNGGKSLSTQQRQTSAWAPAIFHTSMVTQNNGHRLEKRTQGVTLPELQADGVNPSRLLELFERSFDSSLLKTKVVPGELLQEREASRTLADLGLDR